MRYLPHSAVIALLLAAVPAVRAQPVAAPSSRFDATALCVAALKRDIKMHLHPNPVADETQQWRVRLESAFAQIGQAYLDGLSGEQGQQLLQRAEADVAAWPERRLERQAQTCHEQGQILFEQAFGWQRALVRRSAQRWLERELAKLQG